MLERKTSTLELRRRKYFGDAQRSTRSPFAERDTKRCDMRYGYEDQDGINGIRNTGKHSDGHSGLGVVWKVMYDIVHSTYVRSLPATRQRKESSGCYWARHGLALGYRIWIILLLPVSRNFPWDFRYIYLHVWC